MEIVIYILLVFLAVISTCIGFPLEIIHGNIRHLENGREANAGAAIFPSLLVIPLFYVVSAWLLNKTHENVGFYIVITYFVLSVLQKTFSIRKHKKILNEMQK
ncbi:MAG: hypothetical protein COC04_01045 [Gammaproteobacteria bacterium]|nr:MAG: hypothetical protein COC04_01045 [Gammaproteobacteria bacterium]